MELTSSGGSLFELGPVLYNKQIFSHLFQGDEYQNCEEDTPKLRELLSSISTDSLIITKKEISCNDALLVDTTLSVCPQRGSLYNAFGMKDWAPEVNELWESVKEPDN